MYGFVIRSEFETSNAGRRRGMKITNYQLKITGFCLPVQKLSLPLLPTDTYTILGQKIKQLFFEQDKRQCPTMVAGRKQPATYNAQRMSVSHTYGGHCCFIAILKIMTDIKNYFEWLTGSEDGLTDRQFLTLLQEGGIS
jgi:hypothetical protein